MIVNQTPHVLNIHTPSGVVEVAPSGSVARCAVFSEAAGSHEGVPLTRTTMGKVEGLPSPQPGVLYVVSMVVRAACPERKDVASPGPLVRDEKGQPCGCQGLVVN